jgi:hypothetical protein
MRNISTAVKRIKKAGAIPIDTNNLDEFECGITGINPFRVPRNIPVIALECLADLAEVLLLPFQQGWLSYPWEQIPVDQLESHFFIHCNILTTDSISSCPLDIYKVCMIFIQ